MEQCEFRDANDSVTLYIYPQGQYSGKQTSGQYRSIHVWVKGAAGWQLVANQLTAVAAQ
jgi:hypothetical protein